MASKSKSQDIYPNPVDDYQRFVNAYKAKNPYHTRKQVTEEATELWRSIKNYQEKIDAYISSAPKRPVGKKQSTLSFVTKKTTLDPRSAIEDGMKTSCSSTTTNPSQQDDNCYPNSSDIISNETVFRDSLITKKVSDFFSTVIQNVDDHSTISRFLSDESI